MTIKTIKIKAIQNFIIIEVSVEVSTQSFKKGRHQSF